MKKFFLVLLVLLGGASAFSQECPPVNVWILADVSGSIEPDELRKETEAILDALEDWGASMEQGVLWVGCSAFADSCQRVSEFTISVETVRESLGQLPVGSTTDIVGAVVQSMREFYPDEPRFRLGVNIIMILSDGIDSRSMPSPYAIQSYRSEWEKLPPGYQFWVVDISRPGENLFGGGGVRVHDYVMLQALSSSERVYDLYAPGSLQQMIDDLQNKVDCK